MKMLNVLPESHVNAGIGHGLFVALWSDIVFWVSTSQPVTFSHLVTGGDTRQVFNVFVDPNEPSVYRLEDDNGGCHKFRPDAHPMLSNFLIEVSRRQNEVNIA